jgi:beta-glucosidase-like glycosyl hydrolase
MFQTRGRIHFAFTPDPGGNRAKRLAPRRVPSAPDLFIVSSIWHQSIAFKLAREIGSECSARCAAGDVTSHDEHFE